MSVPLPSVRGREVGQTAWSGPSPLALPPTWLLVCISAQLHGCIPYVCLTAWLQEREEGGEAAAKRKRRAAGLDEEDELYLQGSDSEDEMYDRWVYTAVRAGRSRSTSTDAEATGTDPSRPV